MRLPIVSWRKGRKAWGRMIRRRSIYESFEGIAAMGKKQVLRDAQDDIFIKIKDYRQAPRMAPISVSATVR
jgi:hypothetical protein